jgi:hypothetical protein
VTINESLFPKLVSEGYTLTSDPDEGYNCIAWAAGVDDGWWDPADGYPWPNGVPRNYEPDTLVRVFETLGYQRCDDDSLEIDFEKVAIYANGALYEHAAKQLPNGRWTSKMGPDDDIEHGSLRALESDHFGKVTAILKRALA